MSYRGVPSPEVAHVHPYPTRYHGGIWTRPEFGMPYLPRPYEVFRPVQMTAGVGEYFDQMQGIGRTPVGEYFNSGVQGLGQDWDTGTGIFRRPAYDGGGIFNEVSGLGIVDARSGGAFVLGAAVGFAVTWFLAKKK